MLRHRRGTAAAAVIGLAFTVAAGAAAATDATEAWLKEVREKADDGAWLIVSRGADAPADVGVLDRGRQEVIVASESGVAVTPLRAFVAHARRLRAIRPTGWTPETGKAAVARARSHVGRGFRWLAKTTTTTTTTTKDPSDADARGDADARFHGVELAVEAYDGRRAAGWKLAPIVFPSDMEKLGIILFDSGDGGLEARFARRLADARGVPYAAEVAPGLYRGGQPDADGVAWLKSIGVRTVINLRHYHGSTEKERVESAGLGYHRLKLESSDAPETEQVKEFLALVRDPALRPIYVHCKHGVDRTGAMMAVYRMEEDGWTNDDAFAEMQAFYAHRMWQDLRRFVRTYQPQRARPPAPKK